jgi:hypothetical protein
MEKNKEMIIKLYSREFVVSVETRRKSPMAFVCLADFHSSNACGQQLSATGQGPNVPVKTFHFEQSKDSKATRLSGKICRYLAV